MAEIILKHGHVCLIDDADYEHLSKFKWYLSTSGYARRCKKISGVSKTFWMQRDIMMPPDGMFVDHINGNKLDNRRVNLRICTRSQNLRNGSIKSHRKRGKYKGAFWHSCGRWRSHVKDNDGNLVNLGMFATEKEAAIAYNNAALKYYGEFAKLNVLED